MTLRNQGADAPRSPCSQNDIALGYARYLLESGLPFLHLAPAILAQGQHAVLEGLIATGRGVDALHAQLMDEVVGHHQLENSQPPPEAGVMARLAARSPPQGQPRTTGR